MVPAQAPHLVDRAMRIAKATRSPTCDHRPQRRPGGCPTSRRRARTAPSSPPTCPAGRVHVGPDDGPAARAPRRCSTPARRSRSSIGQGAKRAAAEVEQVAELLGAGVAKALNGRAALPDDLPYVTGSIGLLGTKPSYDMMEGCDTLLMVGTSFPYSEWLPEPGQARGVQIDIDARLVGMRYPMEVNLVGDAAETLRALIPLLRAQGGPRAGARRSRSGVDALVADPRRARAPVPPTRSTRSSSSTSSVRGCPTAAS